MGRAAEPAPGSARTWALIAGGGTGGHVVPAIAIGQALVAAGHPAGTVCFVGSRRGLEARLVPEAGFEVVLLPGRGIARRLQVDNLAASAGLVAALVRALVLVGRRRPAVVVSVGGYASLAASLAALVWRVPVVVAEQNAVPGLANRLVARFAAASAVSFAGTPLPRAVLTGNPVREEMGRLDRSPAGREAARRALGYDPAACVVVVSGGSLGARRINEATVALAGAWANRPGLVVHHVVGERDFEELSRRRPVPVPGGLVYRQVRYEDRMDLVFAAADLAVCRAGASTVFELAAAGLPSLLVPLPGAPGDHQTANARLLADAGAARLLADTDLDAARLGAELDSLIDSPRQREAMAAAAAALAVPDAARRVAALAEEHARG